MSAPGGVRRPIWRRDSILAIALLGRRLQGLPLLAAVILVTPAEVLGQATDSERIDDQMLGRLAVASWSAPVSIAPGQSGMERPAYVAYVAARRNGARVAQAWADGDAWRMAVQRAVGEARQALQDDGRASTLEVVLAQDLPEWSPLGTAQLPSESERGRLVLETSGPNGTQRFAPTAMLAANRGFRRSLQAEHLRLIEAEIEGSVVDPELSVRIYPARQWLVSLDSAEATELYRGNRVVRLESIDRAYVQRLVDLQADWMFRQLGTDGRMLYKYWPSAGRQSQANNAIRQWMATIALGRLARRAGDPAKQARVDLNMDYNLARTYREMDGEGRIFDGPEKVKLGALALAAQALSERSPSGELARIEAALRRSMRRLWMQDGSMRTFVLPVGRNDNQNFYPGEALLYWAGLYGREPDPQLLEQLMASFRYYRAWHLEESHRNPAFVPWHTQAWYRLWESTRDPELARFIFEMNDWLLTIQQWDEPDLGLDMRGRFYKPGAGFGPPHASSTGVYLEGLLDAWRLAGALKDASRQEAYRRAIMRGIRSLAQLTFKDEVDMFYVSRVSRVHGGVRTTVHNNEIRVDNVQHGLMAMLGVLEHFRDEDFRP